MSLPRTCSGAHDISKRTRLTTKVHISIAGVPFSRYGGTAPQDVVRQRFVVRKSGRRLGLLLGARTARWISTQKRKMRNANAGTSMQAQNVSYSGFFVSFLLCTSSSTRPINANSPIYKFAHLHRINRTSSATWCTRPASGRTPFWRSSTTWSAVPITQVGHVYVTPPSARRSCSQQRFITATDAPQTALEPRTERHVSSHSTCSFSSIPSVNP